jgi:hypothetical protein
LYNLELGGLLRDPHVSTIDSAVRDKGLAGDSIARELRLRVTEGMAYQTDRSDLRSER